MAIRMTHAEKEQRKKDIEAELDRCLILTATRAFINALDNSTLALEKVSKHMAGIDYENQNPCDKCGRKGLGAEAGGKTMAYIAKVVNEVARLAEFAKGKPDARTEVVGLGDLLKVLTGPQFETVTKWIDEGQKRQLPPPETLQ